MAEPVERRKGNVSHVVDMFIGKQSRKVAFGIWGFMAANAFLASGKITEKTWWFCFLTCAVLIGCGTILDEILAKLGDKIAGVVANKVNAVADAPPAAPAV